MFPPNHVPQSIQPCLSVLLFTLKFYKPHWHMNLSLSLCRLPGVNACRNYQRGEKLSDRRVQAVKPGIWMSFQFDSAELCKSSQFQAGSWLQRKVFPGGLHPAGMAWDGAGFTHTHSCHSKMGSGVGVSAPRGMLVPSLPNCEMSVASWLHTSRR